MSEQEQSPGAGKPDDQPQAEHLNIKVTDNNNEVFFKIKRTTALKKLMDAFCDRQGKAPNTVRFLFDGARVQQTDSPDSVSHLVFHAYHKILLSSNVYLVAGCANSEYDSSTCKMETHWRSTRSKLVDRDWTI